MRNFKNIFIATLLSGSVVFGATTPTDDALTFFPSLDCSIYSMPSNSTDGTVPAWALSGCASSSSSSNSSSSIAPAPIASSSSSSSSNAGTNGTSIPSDSDKDTYGGDISIPSGSTTSEDSDGDVVVTQNSDDGTTTTITIPSDDDGEENYKISSTSGGTTTNVTLHKDVNTKLNSDGSTTSSFTSTDGSNVNITVEKNGQIVLTVEKDLGEGSSSKATITLPAGTSLSTTAMQTDATTINISANDGDGTTKPVALNVSADYGNRNMRLSTVITNPDGSTRTIIMNSKKFALEEVITLIETLASSTRAIEEGEVYTGISSEFKFDGSSFNLPDDENVLSTVYSQTSWQKYRDVQYFDGKRTITLLLGSASIKRGDVVEDMLPGVEYLVGENATESSEDIVDTLLANSPYTIDGYWYFLESNEWDWVYCLANSTAELPCYQLLGFDTTTNEFYYDVENPLAVPTKEIAGYSLKFGSGAWDYTYTPKGFDRTYKLEADGVGFQWSNNLSDYLQTIVDEVNRKIEFRER